MLQTVSLAGGLLCSLSDAKAHLRVNISTDDTLITGLCSVATEIVQRETGMRFFADVYNEFFRAFNLGTGQPMELTRYPVASVSSIQYYDMTNTLQTWGSQYYNLSLPTNCKASFQPVFGTFYPVTLPKLDLAVIVNYTTGFATLPNVAIQACKLIIGHLYTNRESEQPVMSRALEYGLDRMFSQLTTRGYY